MVDAKARTRARMSCHLCAITTMSILMTPAVASPQALPPTVFVEAAENGQGILRGRGKDCFVITPHHVVDGTLNAVTITGNRGARATDGRWFVPYQVTSPFFASSSAAICLARNGMSMAAWQRGSVGWLPGISK